MSREDISCIYVMNCILGGERWVWCMTKRTSGKNPGKRLVKEGECSYCLEQNKVSLLDNLLHVTIALLMLINDNRDKASAIVFLSLIHI